MPHKLAVWIYWHVSVLAWLWICSSIVGLLVYYSPLDLLHHKLSRNLSSQEMGPTMFTELMVLLINVYATHLVREEAHRLNVHKHTEQSIKY